MVTGAALRDVAPPEASLDKPDELDNTLALPDVEGELVEEAAGAEWSLPTWDEIVLTHSVRV